MCRKIFIAKGPYKKASLGGNYFAQMAMNGPVLLLKLESNKKQKKSENQSGIQWEN